ncbi:unnamed protein product [Boreogadus saida]
MWYHTGPTYKDRVERVRVAAAKARSPMVRSLVFGICRDRLLLDLRGRVDVWGLMSSCRIQCQSLCLVPGARPCLMSPLRLLGPPRYA